ncbi:DNA repair protein RadA [Symbiobacterium thermophilum]|uniref:DNA repair protein RadA n=1 Tax=Symbiobacterium thermophilum TaxID=2734 RepID=A0A953I8X1_SYMTR|nr:DNA repair protein RadA [Symbiobacterium thermophilum]MBY6276543.1 DNA repair protein RadA [Symbiobacterium thermophilum]
MAKSRSAFFCQECGYESPRWMGRCPGCGAWNTMVEEPVNPPGGRGLLTSDPGTGGPPLAIGEVETEDAQRLETGMDELDRVLGGGIVPGSFVLVGGDPGIGKSTLLLQLAAAVARQHGTVLYASGEESARQIRMRADRLGTIHPRLLVLAETNLEAIAHHAAQVAPRLLIVDSIQTVFRPDLPSAPGSVSQVRECAAQLLRVAKGQNLAIFIVGHVTKEGSLAGPRVLEHIVDTVLYFEGDRHASFRILRAVKNRFGSTNEIGIFEMRDAGLAPVGNASQLFLAERPVEVAGSVVMPAMEGTRPLLVEVQALVSASTFVTPRRTAEGIDLNRLQLIIAVLEKRVGLLLGNHDAYVKVAGGVRLAEPAIDLALAVALASSFRDQPPDPRTVVVGEVGLAGEVRAVSRIDQRIREAEKMGFDRMVLPRANLRSLSMKTDVELVGVETVMEGLEAALGR